MKKIYFDNAATTPVFDEVVNLMCETMKNTYGNPSSTHHFGRNAKALIELSRKEIAKNLHCQTSELVFTSGGTEALSLILTNAVRHLGIKHIVSSKIEHHAVLKTIQFLEKQGTSVSYVNVLNDGTLDYHHLEELLIQNPAKTLISLMHVNNEIGTILNLKKVIGFKNKYKALFHTDTTQSVGHFHMDLSEMDIDFITASAHKFHGPKGVGFAYFKKGTAIQPLILGGEQERGARAGTENIAAIVGMSKALQICCQNLEQDLKHLKEIKKYFIRSITSKIPTVKFNGMSANTNQSSHTIVNVLFPKNLSMLLFQLDLKGIAVSGGSACQSGSQKGSHVLQEILEIKAQEKTSIRFSFSKLNTFEEVDFVVNELNHLIKH